MNQSPKIIAIYESRSEWAAQHKDLARRCGYEKFLESDESINEIIEAVMRAGIVIVKKKMSWDLSLVLEKEAKNEPQCLVWNLTDGGIYYSGSWVPEIARELKLPFLGSSSLTQMLCQNKPLLKTVAQGIGISTAKGLVFRRPLRSPIRIPEDFQPPFFVKPSLLDNGIGDKVANPICQTTDEAVSVANLLLQSGIDEVLVEMYLPGREFTVIAVEAKEGWIVECAEILHDGPGFFSSEVKGTENYFCEFQSNEISVELNRKALLLAEGIGLRDYFRADFRCDKNGEAQLLEVNSNPFLISNFFECFSKRYFSSLSKMIKSVVLQSYSRQFESSGYGQSKQTEFFLS